jgi:hypothetical protein
MRKRQREPGPKLECYDVEAAPPVVLIGVLAFTVSSSVAKSATLEAANASAVR